jgi:hypothetical protein
MAGILLSILLKTLRGRRQRRVLVRLGSGDFGLGDLCCAGGGGIRARSHGQDVASINLDLIINERA